MIRRVLAIASAISLVLFLPAVGLLILVAVHYEMLQLRVTLADDQVAVFEEMKRSAGKTVDPPQIAEFLAYTVSYYPSGTKQAAGTPLDRIVEASRADAVAAIIARLRLVTGKDFGDNAAPWLREYTPSDTPTKPLTAPATQSSDSRSTGAIQGSQNQGDQLDFRRGPLLLK